MSSPLRLDEFLLARYAEREADLAGHDFSFVEWDTGVGKCRHPSHVSAYAVHCWRATLAPYLTAEIAAHRAIVKQAIPRGWDEEIGAPFGGGYIEAWWDSLRALGAVFADHPDYRQEWRP